jgi:Mrp family chromosome partitioning ATPase
MTASWQPSTPPQAESTDLRDYVRPIWAHKILIVVLVVVSTVGTYMYFDRKPRVYQSSTQVFVGNPSGETTGSIAVQRTLANQARLLQTSEVAARVARKINFRGDPRALLSGISVTASEGTDFVTITGTAADGGVAAQLANAFAQAFIDLREADTRRQAELLLRSLRRRLGQVPAGTDGASLRAALRDQITEIELNRASQDSQARQIDEALPSGVPIAPQPRRNAVFAFALSLLLGIIAAFGLERIDRRLRSSDEAGHAFGLPVIATIPHEREIASRRGNAVNVPDSVRETFRSLRSNLDIVSGGTRARKVLVTSAVPEEGKSTVVRNLALVYAAAGLRVVVIEADLRRPVLAKALAVAPEPGLTDVLMGLATLSDVLQPVAVELPQSPALRHDARPEGHAAGTGVAVLAPTNGGGEPTGRLHVIVSGAKPPDPPAMFAAASMAAMVERVAAQHDMVIIDSPPLLSVSDALPLMALVDGTVVVCRIGASSEEGARRAMDLAGRVPGARILGLVVNGVEGSSDRYGGY